MTKMAFIRFLIILSLFYYSSAAKNEYKFCEDTNGTIIVELDAVINANNGTTTLKLNNIQQGNNTDSCTSNSRRSFRIDFEGNSTLKVVIEEIEGKVYLSEMTAVTPFGKASASETKELSKSGQYYVCNLKVNYTLDSTSTDLEIFVTFNEIKLQGFGVNNGAFSQNFSVCVPATAKPSTKGSTTTTTLSTTTQAPTSPSNNTSTTTIIPNTTVSTTTKNPVTTTTLKTTTTPSHTTSFPPGQIAALDMKSNGTLCLLVEFRGNISFEYKTKKGKTAHYTHVIDANDVKSTNGSCKGDEPFVKGFLSMGCAVEFSFSKLSKLQSATRRLLAASFDYALTNVTVTYDTSKLPDADAGKVIMVSAKPESVSASSGFIYKCNAPQDLLNKNGTVFRVENFIAGAYSPNKNNANECSADSVGNNIVPIVVGVILACLVVIIIVAYLIGRRRNREGYQSV